MTDKYISQVFTVQCVPSAMLRKQLAQLLNASEKDDVYIENFIQSIDFNNQDIRETNQLPK